MNVCFVSDATAGVHPHVMDAITRAQETGPALPYGGDPLTERVRSHLERIFGPNARAIIVLNGTGGNVLGLAPLLSPHEAVICASSAHINVDECGAPERNLGCKLLSVPTTDGKLTPALVEACLATTPTRAAVTPSVISISQATEFGTCYSLDELDALATFARRRRLKLHIDGARLANAAAALGSDLATAAGEADVVSLGFTKNGGLAADAIIYRDEAARPWISQRQKQAMQVAAKMRLLAAQIGALLAGDLWRHNAEHANAMARRLGERLKSIPGLTITQPIETNCVFFRPANHRGEDGTPGFLLLPWDEASGVLRATCSWETPVEVVDELAASIAGHAEIGAATVNAL